MVEHSNARISPPARWACRARSSAGSVHAYSFGVRFSPTLPIGTRGRIWVTGGGGFGYLSYDDLTLTGVPSTALNPVPVIRARSRGDLRRCPSASADSIDIIPRLLSIHAEVMCTFAPSQIGTALQHGQYIDGAGQAQDVGPCRGSTRASCRPSASPFTCETGAGRLGAPRHPPRRVQHGAAALARRASPAAGAEPSRRRRQACLRAGRAAHAAHAHRRRAAVRRRPRLRLRPHRCALPRRSPRQPAAPDRRSGRRLLLRGRSLRRARVLPVPCESDASCAVSVDPRPHPIASGSGAPSRAGRPCRDFVLSTSCERTNLCTLHRLPCPSR